MSLLPYALPAAAALLLIAFFAGLPDLRRCALPRADARRFTASDAVLIALLMLVYGAVAFYSLGNTASPESFVPMEGKSVTLSLPEEGEARELWLFCGVGAGNYAIESSADGEDFAPLTDYEQNYVSVLKWVSVPLEDAPRPLRYLRLRCSSGTPWLGELAVRGADGALLPLSSDQPELIDESGTVPAKTDFMNSSYFDEIYHARTAWEHLHAIWPYEISHPPLGKEIMSLGVLLFGMTPFGWRFAGTLFGVLMLPVLYLLLKRLFGGDEIPMFGTLLLASDFMHFTQTRIATIDTYAVFFILLMYLFMYIWLEEEKSWALALSGLSFGLGAASKWTALYAGAGLAVLWLLHWLKRFFVRRAPGSPCHPERSEGSPRPKHAAPDPEILRRSAPQNDTLDNCVILSASEGSPRPKLLPAFLKNVGFCLIFFVALPALIYYLSYLPYGLATDCRPFSAAYTKLVLDNQRFMFSYHASIVAEHPYSSRWYQWLLDIRPILYYLEYFPDGSRSSICAFLNPALCWGGFLSLFVLGYEALFRADRRAGFILIGYLAELLPWVFISRLTFAYHYFPCSVFLVLSLGYVFALMRENRPRWRLFVLPFAAASLLLFVLFYPVLSGAPYGAPGTALGSGLLQWLPTWPI